MESFSFGLIREVTLDEDFQEEYDTILKDNLPIFFVKLNEFNEEHLLDEGSDTFSGWVYNAAITDRNPRTKLNLLWMKVTD
jgi:hypothetical protein